MKKLLFLPILIFCFSMSVVAKKHTDTTQYPSPFKYILIDSVIGTKDELYIKAYEWAVKTFVSANDVIQMHDKDAGKIFGKSMMLYSENKNSDRPMLSYTHHVDYTISISVKEDKYMCVISDFITRGGTWAYPCWENRSLDDTVNTPKSSYWGGNEWHDIKAAATIKAEDLLSSFKNSMHTKSDNW